MGVLSLSFACLVAIQEPPTQAEVDWLREQAVPLRTVEAGNGFEDLEPLRRIVGDARVVALGESTHGSREQFQLKHRIIEFLVAEMGFDTFSIEASMPESYRVDEFVSRGQGDPVELIRGMYFWTWSTEEVLAMVEWMRDFNARHEGEGAPHVRFTGFDMQTPDVAAAIVAENLERIDSDRAASARQLYADIVSARAGDKGWVSATGMLEPALVAGSKIVFTGQLRSRDVESISLWFRADREGSSAAFMNSALQHRSGDEWVEHRIELDIPEDVDQVVFGLIHSGGGSAWFDDLSLTVDGAAVEPAGFDFTMEKAANGFALQVGAYRSSIDPEVAKAGEASMRIDRVQPLSGEGVDAEEAQEIAGGILAELSDMEATLEAELGTKDARWTIQMARVVQQCMEARTRKDAGARDRAMAANVLWMLDQDPDAKLILWAHNGHVANDTVWMGRHLKDALGGDYLPIGFATSRGEYRAVANDGERGLTDHPLHPAPEGSVESFFEAAGLELALLDLRAAEEGSASSGWLTQTRPMRSIGALEMDRQFFPAKTFPKFDALLYVADTTGAWPLRSQGAAKRGAGDEERTR